MLVRAMPVILVLLVLGCPAWALSDRDAQRASVCMAERTTNGDREKIARVLVQALVKQEVMRDDVTAFGLIMMDKLARCGVDLGELAEDQSILERISSLYMERLLAEGLANIRD